MFINHSSVSGRFFWEGWGGGGGGGRGRTKELFSSLVMRNREEFRSGEWRLNEKGSLVAPIVPVPFLFAICLFFLILCELFEQD